MTKEEAIKILYEMEYKTAYSGELGGLAVEMAVEALRNHPSLPSNLDEAAEEWAKKKYGENYMDFPDEYRDKAINALLNFKAGAEWMTKQNIKTKTNKL